ncbi:MAG: hypothetical protein ACXU8U_08145 [Asticcacaulis sp.]
MSSLLDMISAFIALLMSAAFLHFGANGDAPRQNHPAPVASQAAASWSAASLPAPDSTNETDSPAHVTVHAAKAARKHVPHARLTQRVCPRSYGGQPVLNALRSPSPARRG